MGGEVLAYPGRAPCRARGGAAACVRDRPLPRGAAGGPGREDWGRSDFLITTGQSYNRVEGLPVTFGPRIETEGSNPLRMHALAIYRTESRAHARTPTSWATTSASEQFLGGHRGAARRAHRHSLVDPIEDWHLSDLENGLSTFLLHRDYRDHYEREGVSGFAAWEPGGLPLSLTLEARWEDHALAPGGQPLGDLRQRRRLAPAAAGGRGTSWRSARAPRRATTLAAASTDPATGWLVRGRGRAGAATMACRPAALAAPAAGGGSVASPLDCGRFDGFTSGMVDVRRYNRVDPALAPQLPAGGRRARSTGSRSRRSGSTRSAARAPSRATASSACDCGARASRVSASATLPPAPPGPGTSPRYGCDAFALLQAEYRGKLSFRLRWDDAPWDDDGATTSEGRLGPRLGRLPRLVGVRRRRPRVGVRRPPRRAASRVDVGAGCWWTGWGSSWPCRSRAAGGSTSSSGSVPRF